MHGVGHGDVFRRGCHPGKPRTRRRARGQRRPGQRSMGWPLRRRSRGDHAGDQCLDRLRPPALAPGHRRLAGARRDAGPHRHHRRRRCELDRGRPERHRRRHRRRPLRLRRRPGGHPHGDRGRPIRAHRRARPPAAHRAQPQRPGGDRLPALGARRHRRPRRPGRRPDAQPGRARAAACERPDARLHPPADRAAGDVRPPPAGLCRDAGARPRPPRRRPPPAQPVPARLGRPRRHLISDRPVHDLGSARLRPPHRELPGRRLRPRLRAGIPRRPVDPGDAPVAPGRGDRALVLGAVRFRSAVGRLHHRLIDHAAEAQPGRRRVGARQDRPRHRRPGRAADGDEGPAAGLCQGHAGGQGAGVPGDRRHQPVAGRAGRHDPRPDRRPGTHARPRGLRLLDRDRPRRLAGAPAQAAVPHRPPRHRAAGGACRGQGRRAGRPRPRRDARGGAGHRRRRVQRAERGSLGGIPGQRGRHRACPGPAGGAGLARRII